MLISFSIKSTIDARRSVDIGICACHVWLGLIDRGYNPHVTISEDTGRAVWRLSVGRADESNE